MFSFKTDKVDEFQEEIDKLKEGCELLEEIWSWYGPYGPEKKHRTKRRSKKVAYDFWVERMPEELHSKLMRFFDFDDSE